MQPSVQIASKSLGSMQVAWSKFTARYPSAHVIVTEVPGEARVTPLFGLKEAAFAVTPIERKIGSAMGAQNGGTHFSFTLTISLSSVHDTVKLTSQVPGGLPSRTYWIPSTSWHSIVSSVVPQYKGSASSQELGLTIRECAGGLYVPHRSRVQFQIGRSN